MPVGSIQWAQGPESGSDSPEEAALLSDDEVGRAVDATLGYRSDGGDAEAVVDIVFVDDATLTRMHGEFLDDPTPTDVITFDLRDSGEGEPELPPEARGPDGELYISVERALEVAAERSVDPRRELTLYVVHGTLHLVGYDDHEPEERARMRVAESEILASLGFPGDLLPHDR